MTFRKGKLSVSAQLEHSAGDLSCKVIPRLDLKQDFLPSCHPLVWQSPSGAVYHSRHLPEQLQQTC